MQIVIDIPEEVYGALNENSWNSCFVDNELTILEQAFCNGTVLPKGHGDLVDMNTLTSTYNLQGELTSYDAVVVLEADKEDGTDGND